MLGRRGGDLSGGQQQRGAAHGGDHAIYPDCREEFAQSLDQAIQLADWHPVSLNRPFVQLSKDYDQEDSNM